MTIVHHYRQGDILLLYALALILTLSSTAFGWIPRLTTRYGNFQSCSRRRILLSFANKSNDNDMPDKSDEISSSSGDTNNNNKGEEDDRLPLFSSEVDHHASVLKLEAIFNDIDTKDKSASLINSKDRVVLDSWMDWTGDDSLVPCAGDSCGDVDVSIFFRYYSSFIIAMNLDLYHICLLPLIATNPLVFLFFCITYSTTAM